jgi:hypothetical protein
VTRYVRSASNFDLAIDRAGQDREVMDFLIELGLRRGLAASYPVLRRVLAACRCFRIQPHSANHSPDDVVTNTMFELLREFYEKLTQPG